MGRHEVHVETDEHRRPTETSEITCELNSKDHLCVCGRTFPTQKEMKVCRMKKGCAYASLNAQQPSVTTVTDTKVRHLKILARVYPTAARTFKLDIVEMHASSHPVT